MDKACNGAPCRPSRISGSTWGAFSAAAYRSTGWFTEIKIARNLWEADRYNQAEAIARSFGLDTSKRATLWRDRDLLELNVAVLHSFTKAKVPIIDHQTASRQFMTHDLRKKGRARVAGAVVVDSTVGRGQHTARVLPPEMRDFHLNPSLHYATDRWAVME